MTTVSPETPPPRPPPPVPLTWEERLTLWLHCVLLAYLLAHVLHFAAAVWEVLLK